MAGFFDEDYYLKHKVEQLTKAGEKTVDGQPYTVDTLKAVFSEMGITVESHYNAYGRNENLNPNPYFNEVEYLTAKKALLAETDPMWAAKNIAELRTVIEQSGMTAADHYQLCGAFEANSKGELLNPSNAFDANAYYAAKLVQLKAAGVEGADTMTVAQVVEAFKAYGVSPVAHYESYGAGEAATASIPLVQTVPSDQRVANDPARTENVPGNYNPPTTGAANPAATAAPVAKPADMGAKVPPSVSPPVELPSKPLLTPDDSGYVAPPAGLVDTNTKPVVPPSSATNGNWAQVNPDGSADLVKPDGGSAGTVPPGSLKPNDPSNPGTGKPIQPETPGDSGGSSGGESGGGSGDNPGDSGGSSGGESGGGSGGGSGGESGGGSGDNPDGGDDVTAEAEAARVSATFNETTKTLNISLKDDAEFTSTIQTVVDEDGKVTMEVQTQGYMSAPVTVPSTTGITSIETGPRTSVSVDLTNNTTVTKFTGSETGKAEVEILKLEGYTISHAHVICDYAEKNITLTDADFAAFPFTDTSLMVKANGTVDLTLGAAASKVGFDSVRTKTPPKILLESDFAPASGKFVLQTIEGDGYNITNKSPSVTPSVIVSKSMKGTITASGEGTKNIEFDASTALSPTVSFEELALPGFNNISFEGRTWGCGNSSIKYDILLGTDTLKEKATIDLKNDFSFLDGSKNTTGLTVISSDAYDDFRYQISTPNYSTGAMTKLTGGSGNDTLDGGSGNNTLTGGGGTNTFVISSTLREQIITDFAPNSDTIHLNSNLFAGMAAGKVTTAQFLSGSGTVAATDANQRFIYNTVDGKLYFDADGNGSDFNAVHFATLGAEENRPGLTATDLVIKDDFNSKMPDNTLRYAVLHGSEGKDKLIIADNARFVAGGAGDDLFLVNLENRIDSKGVIDAVNIKDFFPYYAEKTDNKKIGLTNVEDGKGGLTLATGSNISHDGKTYSITQGVLKASDSSAITAAIAEAVMAQVENGDAKGKVLAYIAANKNDTHLYISDGTTWNKDTSIDCDIVLTGVSDITGITVADGYITNFTD